MKFKAIAADPAWPYKSGGPVGWGGKSQDGLTRAGVPIRQVNSNELYPSISIPDLLALPVEAVADKDCLLFLWTTNAFLANGVATEVVKAWGFRPVTVVTWAKAKADRTPSMKTGHWFRGATEHFILGVRGAPKRLPDYPAIPTWWPGGRLPHSVKPERFYQMVELACDGPWLEMFARRPRGDGWETWGNQMEQSFDLMTGKKT